MKFITFTKIGLKNYCCFIDQLDIEIKPNNLVLICGANGNGKSTIFNSIRYTLYGTTDKGLKGDQVVNRKVGRNCHTYVEFNVRDDSSEITTEYRIDRYYKHSSFGNSVIVKRNNVALTKGITEAKPLIEKIIMPEKLFSNTLFFGQKVQTFFTDLKDSEQKEIFKLILQTDKYTGYYRETDKRLNDTEEEIDNVNSNQHLLSKLLEDCTSNICTLEKERKRFYSEKGSKLQSLKSKLQSDSKEFELLEDIKIDRDIDDQIMKLLEDIKNLERDSEQVTRNCQSEVDKVKVETSEKISYATKHFNDKKVKILEDQKEKEKEVRNKYDSKIKDKEKELYILINDINLFESKIENLNSEIKKLKNNFFTFEKTDENLCPVCGQTISGHSKEKVEKEKEKIKENLSKLESSKEELLEKKAQVFNTKQQLGKSLSEVENSKEEEMKDSSNYFSSLLTELESKYDQHIKNLEVSKRDKESILRESIQSQLLSLKSKIRELNIKRNELREQSKIKELNEKKKSDLKSKIDSSIYLIKETEKSEFDESILNSYMSKRKDTEAKIIDGDESLHNLNRKKIVLEIIKTAFSPSGIPNMLIDESIPYINSRLSNYLNEVSNGRYLMSLDTVKEIGSKELRDKININVLDTQTLADSRLMFSGGQTRLLDICTILSLCDLQNRVQNIWINLLLFDEIFDSLDDQNASSVSSLLKMLTKNKSIFIISHRHSEFIEADEVLKL